MLRLKELRLLSGKTQDEMAFDFSVNRTTYTKWETDKHNPDVETVSKLADYFNVTTDYLLGKTDNPAPPDSGVPSKDEILSGMTPEEVLNAIGVKNKHDKRMIAEMIRLSKENSTYEVTEEVIDIKSTAG